MLYENQVKAKSMNNYKTKEKWETELIEKIMVHLSNGALFL